MKILIINGPNLNMLGRRDPKIYGAQTAEQINGELAKYAASLGAEAEFFQSNGEGELIDAIQGAYGTRDGIVINAGAYTHYSHAIADALECVPCPKIEVHLSNVHCREEFRHTSVLSRAVNGVICGFGADSYRLAVQQLVRMIQKV